MATTTIPTLREQREAVVKAHIEAEAVTHDVAAALATFRHPRYEVPAVERSPTARRPFTDCSVNCSGRSRISGCTSWRSITRTTRSS